MKVFFVVTIARQVEGEIVSIRFDKAFSSQAKADEYAKSLSKTFKEMITVPDYGPVEFHCERGVHDIELED